MTVENQTFRDEPGIKIGEVVSALESEANRIESSQRALVAAGLRATPHDGEMRRARCLDAARKIILAMMPNWSEHLRMMQQRRGGR